jgi:GT2 family glycosyltransferase
VIYFPGARVFHRVSPKGRAKSSAYYFYQIRNWIWIFYRYYPPLARLRKIAMYVPVYLAKGAAGGQLWACVRGIAAGLGATRIIADHADKLTGDQVGRLEALNTRRTVRFGR